MFAVCAHNHLMLRNNSRLDRCRTFVVTNQSLVFLHAAVLAQRAAQFLSRGIVANHADHCCPRAERGHVRQHIGRAAEPRGFALNVNHRHRRFRRNSGDVAPDKLVEHHIAYDYDVTRARARQDFFSSLLI